MSLTLLKGKILEAFNTLEKSLCEEINCLLKLGDTSLLVLNRLSFRQKVDLFKELVEITATEIPSLPEGMIETLLKQLNLSNEKRNSVIHPKKDLSEQELKSVLTNIEKATQLFTECSKEIYKMYDALDAYINSEIDWLRGK